MLIMIEFSYRVVKNEHFRSTFLGGRGSQKGVSYSVYAFDNVDNYGRPLTYFEGKKTIKFIVAGARCVD